MFVSSYWRYVILFIIYILCNFLVDSFIIRGHSIFFSVNSYLYLNHIQVILWIDIALEFLAVYLPKAFYFSYVMFIKKYVEFNFTRTTFNFLYSLLFLAVICFIE